MGGDQVTTNELDSEKMPMASTETGRPSIKDRHLHIMSPEDFETLTNSDAHSRSVEAITPLSRVTSFPKYVRFGTEDTVQDKGLVIAVPDDLANEEDYAGTISANMVADPFATLHAEPKCYVLRDITLERTIGHIICPAKLFGRAHVVYQVCCRIDRSEGQTRG